MSNSIVKEKDSSCNIEEEHITCTDDMKNLNITCTEQVDVDVCANCGKEGSDLNICNKCKDAKYCNAACKKKHRTKHKKKCEKRAAEIQAALHDIELFKPPPLAPADCPICMLPLPSMDTGYKYYSCCGKHICSGCVHAVALRDNGVGLCPFCRTPAPDKKEYIKRVRTRVEVGDATAMLILGCAYDDGNYGLPRDRIKALELYHRAGELGYTKAYNNVGHAYHTGEGVERDEKKADYYYELAAMGRYVAARHNLGNVEFRAGNWDRALEHYMIAAGDGQNESVKAIQELYKLGHATKDDYAKALRGHQAYLDDIKSPQRDQAAAYHDDYKYY